MSFRTVYALLVVAGTQTEDIQQRASGEVRDSIAINAKKAGLGARHTVQKL
jgi:Tfp pilus assembly protein PilX